MSELRLKNIFRWYKLSCKIVKIIHSRKSENEEMFFFWEGGGRGSIFCLFVCLFCLVLIDCCLQSYDGEEEFKGRYSFPEIIVNNTHTAKCKYNSAEVSRKCVSDMKNGPFWGETNLVNCDARYTTTNNLLKLNQVSVC